MKDIALGIQDYRKIIENNYYYVDKTRMISEFLERKAEVTLITRPRRFGKTLNMSMLAEFLDITKDSKAIFEGTEIMQTCYANEMNQFPVIFLSFKDAKGNRNLLIKQVKLALLAEYQRFSVVFNQLSHIDRKIYEQTLSELLDYNTGSLTGIDNALSFLSRAAFHYYQKPVIMLIDEYDTPFLEAHLNGFYDEVHSELSVMLSSALEGNESLYLAMLTGIQRVAKENIFSGLNNLLVCTVKDPEFKDCFGFTMAESEKLLDYYGMELDEKVKSMYDGYSFSGAEIYNPWSILNYAQRKSLQPYWVNTSENKMIRSAMTQCDKSFYRNYDKLIESGTLTTSVQPENSFYEMPSTSSLWGLLLNSGMITIEHELEPGYYQVRIPNQEVKSAFIGITEYYLQIQDGALGNLFGALRHSDIEGFIAQYRVLLETLPSYHDLKDENSYHMMMLGICITLSGDYEISSNREWGYGRSDILLRSKSPASPHVIMEFKYTKDTSYDLEKLAEEALQQIEEKRYAAGLDGTVLCIGLGHRGKCMEAVWKIDRKK
ncbi:ATP-binding protein [Faecalicatena sp. AGMB00832]|uniref:ATP-binding protein n=1 Tax=Faecalicatena faecalis TaxID=2726362 RepID=A0ABS6CZW4_9FIRM|nr:AAA family ATPase [Faecalicatena faecalis]MBU3874877.1 ATP-binding protein [Faecalicatena faecalis]